MKFSEMVPYSYDQLSRCGYVLYHGILRRSARYGGEGRLYFSVFGFDHLHFSHGRYDIAIPLSRYCVYMNYMLRYLRRYTLAPVAICCGISSDTFLESKELPMFTADEVRKNDGTNGKPMFVTFRGGVHDITEFRKNHPGGAYIDQAAGGDVESFWNIWAYHYLSKKVLDTLEETRIGNLAPSSTEVPDINVIDPYSSEPYRDETQMKVLTMKPFTSETKPSVLGDAYLTPAEALYVRNHAPVPQYMDAATHTIEFGIHGQLESEEMSLSDISRHFDQKSVTSVLQCAGNRAAEDIAATGPSAFSGTPFENIESGMVGNVKWGGVWLREVLTRTFPGQCSEVQGHLTEKIDNPWHVIFRGTDGYATSVPLAIVLDPKIDALLATQMNDCPLTPDHGYPVRVVLPGIAGARSVKWLESISLSRSPSEDPWNSYYYRHADGSHIQFLPQQAIILSPTKGEVVSATDGTVRVRGVAYSAGGDMSAEISDVEVSVDGGEKWVSAVLMKGELRPDDAHVSSLHGWVRFAADVKVKTSGSTTVCCRARDSAGNCQPKVSVKQRGYLYNGWNTVDFTTNLVK